MSILFNQINKYIYKLFNNMNFSETPYIYILGVPEKFILFSNQCSFQ